MNSVTFELEDLYEEDTMAEQSLCDGIDLKWMYEGNSDEEDDTDSSPTKIHEKMSTRARLRRILLRTTKSRIISTFFDIVVKGLCVFDLYTVCHLRCFVCLAFIQCVTLVVMCVWPLYRVSPWLLCVFGLYTGCHLGWYVCFAFIQGVTLAVMCV